MKIKGISIDDSISNQVINQIYFRLFSTFKEIFINQVNPFFRYVQQLKELQKHEKKLY